MKFRKHEYGKAKKDLRPMFQVNKDVRSEPHRTLPTEKAKSMLEKLQEVQVETGQVIGWCHILPQNVPGDAHEKSHMQGDEVLAPVQGAEELSHEEGHATPVLPAVQHHENQSLHNTENILVQDLVSPIKEHPVSAEFIDERCKKIKRKLLVTADDAKRIEAETREQSNSDLWYYHRSCRITASKCYRIAAMKSSTSPTKAIKECLYKRVVPTKCMKEGLAKEPEILRQYVEHQKANGHEGLFVTQSGFIIGADGFLGASPDGLVKDPASEDAEGLLEMKYVQRKEPELLREALVRKRVCRMANGKLMLNRNHQYFYQIQQAMYVTERKWTDFVVMGSDCEELYIERVQFDNKWWGQIKTKLETFFDAHICPELAYPRVKFGLRRISNI